MRPTALALLLALPLSLQAFTATAQEQTESNLFAVQTPAGTFLSASNESSTTLSSSATSIGLWEQFRMVPLGGAKYAVQVLASDKYLTATEGGGVADVSAVTTSGTSVGENETFVLACSESGVCALQTAGGYYLAATPDGVRTDLNTATDQVTFRLLTPTRDAPAAAPASPAPASRAKSAVIAQVFPVVVLGAVGQDRFGGWEDALAAGFGAGRSGSGSQSAYAALTTTGYDPFSPWGGDSQPLEPTSDLEPGDDDQLPEDQLPKVDLNCEDMESARDEAARNLRMLRALENVKNNPDFAIVPLTRIQDGIKEGEGKLRRLPTQEELALASALNVQWDPETDKGWQAFPERLQQALEHLTNLSPLVDSLYLGTEIARYEEGLAKMRTELEKCPPKKTTLFASMAEEETADFSWKSTWIRLGDSDLYAAHYTDPHGKSFGYTVNQVSTTLGSPIETFTARRMSSPDGNLCTYSGAIHPNGTTVSGTYKCRMGTERPWRGTINW